MRLRAEGRVLRVGHKGAAALSPENTIPSLAKAIELGVDLVEFDVLALVDGTLVLAHSDDLDEVSHGGASGLVGPLSLEQLRAVAPGLPTLDEALAFLAGTHVGVHVDLKSDGYEEPVVDALRRHGLVDRALVSTVHGPSLRRLAELEPAIARGLTYPYDRRGLSRRRALAPATFGALETLGRALPYRIGELLARAQATVAVLQYRVVTRAAIARCHRLGVPVFAWTVDRPAVLERLARWGVDGVITNDPGIFLTTLRS